MELESEALDEVMASRFNNVSADYAFLRWVRWRLFAFFKFMFLFGCCAEWVG